jgi:hypothetical protein
VPKSVVRRAVLDLYRDRADLGDGAEPAIGTAKRPGPLYAMRGSEHAWDALALALAWLGTVTDKEAGGAA